MSINPPKEYMLFFLSFTERLVYSTSKFTNSAGYKYRLRAFILRVLEPWDDPNKVVYDQVYLDCGA